MSNEVKITSKTGIFGSLYFWAFLVLVLFSVPLIMSFRSPKLQVPPVLGALPDFNLTDQEGRKIQYSRDLKGAVLVSNFIFTRCPEQCPLMSKRMMEIQGRLKGTARSIQLVSFTVDPKHDTPERLKEYGKDYNNDPRLWHMLTGNEKLLLEMANNNFKAAVGRVDENIQKMDEDEGLAEILHSEFFFLIDQVGQIREFMRVDSPEDVNKLLKRVAVLVNTNPPMSSFAEQHVLPASAR